MTLNSPEVNEKDYKAIFNALEDIFRPEVNDTMTHFHFRDMKEKHGQSVDSFYNNPCLALPQCQYVTSSAHEQLKDQFIFGVTICGVQDNLLRTIRKDNGIIKCLHEARKVISMIKQRKLLSIHRGSNSFDHIQQSCSQSKSHGHRHRRFQSQQKD